MRLPKLTVRGRTRAATGLNLPFPATQHLRVALFGGVRCFENVAVFSEDRWRDLIAFAPQVLTAEPPLLLKLADYVFYGAWRTPSVDTCIFTLTQIGKPLITADQRHTIFRAFGVPVYELLIDADDGVLAGECPAHEGWHILHPQLRYDLQASKVVFQKHGLSATPLPTGLTADGMDGMCACGADTPMLRNVRDMRAVESLTMRVAGA